jgi:hypothetical protein
MDFVYPKIRIQRGWLLEETALMVSKQIEFLKEHQKNFSAERMKKIIQEYRTEWAEYENKILPGICGILNLEFLHNIIDVHIVSCWTSAMSSPLIIPSYCPVEQFPHTLTHELLHRLLSDNTQNVDTYQIRDKMFPSDLTSRTRNHIIVHAVHKEIFLEILNRPDFLSREIERCQKASDYKASWDYVEKNGHLKIINQFKDLAGLNR